MNSSTHSASGSQKADLQLSQLVENARDGDRLAFDQLLDRFQGDIYRMIYYRIRSQMDAEDLTQELARRNSLDIQQMISAIIPKLWSRF